MSRDRSSIRPQAAAPPASKLGAQSPAAPAAIEGKANKAFSDFVAYERPRRIADMAKSIYDVVHMDCAEYITTQPVRFTKKHPYFGQAARCGEILTGCDAGDVIEVHFDPTREGPAAPGEVARVSVMVATVDRRWHEASDLSIERLVGAWLDARQ